MHYREKRISNRSVNRQGTAIEQYRKIPNQTPGYVLFVLVTAKDIGEEDLRGEGLKGQHIVVHIGEENFFSPIEVATISSSGGRPVPLIH